MFGEAGTSEPKSKAVTFSVSVKQSEFRKGYDDKKKWNEPEFCENINHFLSPRSTDIQRGGTIFYGSGRVSLSHCYNTAKINPLLINTQRNINPLLTVTSCSKVIYLDGTGTMLHRPNILSTHRDQFKQPLHSLSLSAIHGRDTKRERHTGNVNNFLCVGEEWYVICLIDFHKMFYWKGDKQKYTFA